MEIKNSWLVLENFHTILALKGQKRESLNERLSQRNKEMVRKSVLNFGVDRRPIGDHYLKTRYFNKTELKNFSPNTFT